jgi:hypothetical protein
MRSAGLASRRGIDPMKGALTTALATMLLIAGAACAKPQAAMPGEVDALVAKGDTVGLARLAERECRGMGAGTQTCYEDYFVRLAGSDRVHIALGALAALADRHKDIQRDGHGYTHVIGIRAWKPGANVRDIFRSCTGLFQSGCYHGVIQAYLTQGGVVDSARAVQLCNEIAPGNTDRWLRFQCVHGLGHGFEMAWNWELPKALKGCNWLHGSWDQYSCYGGVFMENAVASMPGGHHTSVHALAATAPSGDSMAGHDMAGMPGMAHEHAPDPTKITFKMRDSTDALYPCSIVDTMYQFSCYQLQGGLILARVHSDFAKATTECDRAPPMGRSQCYVSLGTNASGFTLQNTPKAIAYCSHGDPGYQPFCFVGAVKNYIDVTARPEDGLAFCNEVPKGFNRPPCFAAVGEEIAVLRSTDMEARKRDCAKAAPDGIAECRRGAELPPVP